MDMLQVTFIFHSTFFQFLVVIVNKKYNYSISYHLIIGSESLLSSNKLERLDLGDNLFNQSIIQSLRLLKSLKTMSTTFSQLEGTFPVKGMPILHNNYKNSQKFLIFTSIFDFFRTFDFQRLGDVGLRRQSAQWLPNTSRYREKDDFILILKQWSN